jgi:hypothetical protein
MAAETAASLRISVLRHLSTHFRAANSLTKPVRMWLLPFGAMTVTRNQPARSGSIWYVFMAECPALRVTWSDLDDGCVAYREPPLEAIGAARAEAFGEARRKSVLCFAHVTNQMGQSGDFDKGEAMVGQASGNRCPTRLQKAATRASEWIAPTFTVSAAAGTLPMCFPTARCASPSFPVFRCENFELVDLRDIRENDRRLLLFP